MTLPLWKHQADAIEYFTGATLRAEGALIFDPGTGKTRTALEIAVGWERHSGRVLRKLILCPPIVVLNWAKECALYTDIPADEVVCLTGHGQDRVKKMRERCFSTDGKPLPAVVITNYESLLNEDLYKLLMEWGPEVFIPDEMHRLKSLTAKRTKLALPLAKKALFRLGLTGTFVLNSLMDIFAQWLVIDQGTALGKNFFVFRKTYFYDRNANMPKFVHFPNWQPQPGAADRISRKIGPAARIAHKAECLDLPPLLKTELEVDLSPAQHRDYENMRKVAVAEIRSGVYASADMAITKLMRMRQIISGFILSEDGTVYRYPDNPREEALKGTLEGLVENHKVIVWAVFKEDYVTIQNVCSSLGIQWTQIVGGAGAEKAFAAAEEFQNNPEIRVLIGNPASAGEGINLTASSYSVYYSRDFSLKDYLQSEARNYRGGSDRHESVTHIDLVAKNTIDRDLVSALRLKRDVAEYVVERLKAETDLINKKG